MNKYFCAAVIPSGEGFTFRTHGISVKGAPRDSLFGRFSLQALRFGTCNIRGAYIFSRRKLFHESSVFPGCGHWWLDAGTLRGRLSTVVTDSDFDTGLVLHLSSYLRALVRIREGGSVVLG